MNPPRINNLWLAASASAGGSRSVGTKRFDQRIERPYPNTSTQNDQLVSSALQICSVHLFRTLVPHTCSAHLFRTLVPHTCSAHLFHIAVLFRCGERRCRSPQSEDPIRTQRTHSTGTQSRQSSSTLRQALGADHHPYGARKRRAACSNVGRGTQPRGAGSSADPRSARW